MSVITYPVPAFQNFPINAQYYQPSQFFISAVTLGGTTTVTTTVNHNYVVGQTVRLVIPPSFGCRQLNGTSGQVLSIPNPNQVVVTINSSVNVDPFKASSATTQPQILAIGDVNSGQTNANGPQNSTTYIPGSFINISPL